LGVGQQKRGSQKKKDKSRKRHIKDQKILCESADVGKKGPVRGGGKGSPEEIDTKQTSKGW